MNENEYNLIMKSNNANRSNGKTAERTKGRCVSEGKKC